MATTNIGKVREIKKILDNDGFELITLKDIDYHREIEETGSTFIENAVIKARTVGNDTGYLTIGEDSGLVVDVLDGKPGVLSARYVSGTDSDRNAQILKELRTVLPEKRTARFIAVVSLYNPETKKVINFQGVSEGMITLKPKGVAGFGYDPIFYNSDLGKTNAEAAIEEKNQVSHRARAFKKLKKYLLDLK